MRVMDDSGHLPSRSALILYGSETGSAQDVAEEIGRLCERLHFDTRVSELNAIGLDELLKYTVVVFSISTTGQGDLPANSQILWRKLRSARLRPGCLSDLLFTSFGLGDSSYPRFNWAHRKLYKRISDLGGRAFCDRGESDEQHPEGIDGAFLNWIIKLRHALLQQFPLEAGQEPMPDSTFLVPKWEIRLQPSSSAARSGLQQSTPSESPGLEGGSTPERPSDAETSVTGMHTNTSTSETGRFIATLTNNQRITPVNHWQDVRLFEFATPNVAYSPGDVLTIYPHNSPTAVDEFLALMDWTSVADTQISFHSSSRCEEELANLHNPFSNLAADSSRSLTLRTLISEHLDLNAIPRRSFFAQLVHFTEDATQRDRLLEFTDPQYVDELFDYTTRPRRSILEVLQEFYTVKIPLKWLAAILPAIRGRQFSIASGGLLKFSKHDENKSNLPNQPHDLLKGRIQLLVAIVRYRTVIKKLREGLCTRYLASLQPGTQLRVLLSKGGMKLTPDQPSVMVGPGTGVAPLRAMIYERAALLAHRTAAIAAGGAAASTPYVSARATGEQALRDDDSKMHPPRQLLFFGGRNRSADFFFENEWEALRAEGVPLDVVTAFSRDQPAKIYVQDAIRAHAPTVYKLLCEQNGVIYVCGSSGKMPQAVREALIEVFEKSRGGTGVGRGEAEAMLARMEKEGRYWQETW